MGKFLIQVTVQQPGYENTDAALGLLSLDFDDEQSWKLAVEIIRLRSTEAPRHPVFVSNEKGVTISWEAKYYHSMWAGPHDEWTIPNWQLPEHGSPAPPRES